MVPVLGEFHVLELSSLFEATLLGTGVSTIMKTKTRPKLLKIIKSLKKILSTIQDLSYVHVKDTNGRLEM